MSHSQPELILELLDVSLSYGSNKKTFDHGVHRVLDSVSLKLYEGESLGIVGRNGCGKTTILRIIAGIVAPNSGKVWRREGTTAALLSLGLGFRPSLTGRDNALLAGMLQGASEREAKNFLARIKEFSELGDAFEEPVKTYSSGMRARLGFTTALMTEVDILLIDEVLSVGDTSFRAKAQAALKERVNSHQTAVFVSHNEGQVKAICDRAVCISEGKIRAEGDVDEVLQVYRASLERPSHQK